MRLHRVAPIFIGFALGACFQSAIPLNSELIHAEYGNYGIDVISAADGLRRASLYSTHDSDKITRTYAVVRFDNVPEGLIDREHARILAGASVGATFKATGWTVEKRTRHIGTMRLTSDPYAIRDLMHLDNAPDLAMHVYRLWLRKDEQSIDYATIIELHHPDYLNESQLSAMYPVDSPAAIGADEICEWRSLIVAHDSEPITGHDTRLQAH